MDTNKLDLLFKQYGKIVFQLETLQNSYHQVKSAILKEINSVNPQKEEGNGQTDKHP